MSTALSDNQLIERVRAGDRESYGVLAMRHRKRLQGFAQRFVRDTSEAEDAVQSAHLLALRHFDQYEGRSAYFQWMASITLNEIRNRYRQNRLPVRSDDCQDRLPSATPNPEQVARYQEMLRIVESALDRLAPAYSVVFRLRALRELSVAETGRMLGLSEACVKTRLRRARIMLQQSFKARAAGVQPVTAWGRTRLRPGCRDERHRADPLQ